METTEEQKHDKFSLDPAIFRTMQERCTMVEDPDCPLDVLETVATYDQDQLVLESIYFLPNLNDKIRSILKDRLEEKDDTVLKQKKILREYEAKDQRWKVFCTIPWNHIATNADGSVRMCCQMTQNDIEPKYGTLYKETSDSNVKEAYTGSDDPEAYRNHPALKEIRSAMLKGIDPSICKLCTMQEATGVNSRRVGTKDKYPSLFERALVNTKPDGTIDSKQFPLQYLDLRFGNKCNLACRSCGPTDSNLWYEDFYKLTEEWEPDKKPGGFSYRDHAMMYIEKDKNGKYDVPEINNWWEDSGLFTHIIDNIENIDRYYFTGGEPTINLKHRQLLDIIIEKGLAHKVHLEYNTNMAGVPMKVFDQWKHFRHVGIGMSLDGMYEHFEYMRYPGKWNKALRGMNRIDKEDGFDRVSASVALTLSIYNVLHVLDFVWWHKEQNFARLQDWFNISMLYGPDWMNIQNLPNEVKQFIEQRYIQFKQAIDKKWPENDNRFWRQATKKHLNAVLDHMWKKEANTQHWDKFFQITGQLDNIRNEKFSDVCPELLQVFRDVKEKESRKKSATLASVGKKR